MQYDSTIKCISPELSAEIAALVLGRKPNLKPMISESFTADERRVDFLAKITGDEEALLHIEFQTRYDKNMPVRMLAYYARILDRHGLPIYPVVVYLTETNSPIETAYNSHIGGRQVIAFNYDVIKVWELKSKTIFKEKLFGLYTLTPLMPDADLAECNEKVIDAVEHNFISVDSYTCMVTLARLKYSKDEVKNMIKDKLMRESPFYNDLVEDISAETRTKWIKEGREEGMEQGMERGVEQGMKRGVEGSVITVLAARFGAVPDRLSGRVHSIRERGMDMLNELMKLAATVNDVDEFERKLDKMM